jgi:type I restriction enzyme, S subunit
MSIQSETVRTPKLRFPDYKSHLRSGTLGEFGYFYYGKSAPKWSLTEGAKTPCVRYGELYSTYNEYISSIKSYTDITPESLKFSKGGEVLVPRVGEDPLDFANCSYLPISGVAIGEMISVYNTEEDGLFFTYFINAKLKKAFARVVEGGNVSNLYYKYLEDIEITIPEKQEQTKIASFLSSIDSKIEKLVKKQELLGEYKKGVIQKIFTQTIRFKADDGSDYPDWEKKKIRDIFNISAGGDINKSNTHPVQNEKYQYPVYANSEKNKGLYSYSDIYKQEGNCITVTGRGSLGLAVARYDKFYPIVRLLILRGKQQLNIKFFEEAMNLVRIHIESTGVPQLTAPQLKNYTTLYPSLPEQTKIANFLSSIDSKIEQIGKQLDETKQFKKALLQQMFV